MDDSTHVMWTQPYANFRSSLIVADQMFRTTEYASAGEQPAMDGQNHRKILQDEN